MADEPKISKHHSGQHPALKSFRAFDIIPAGKVKPGHTARPIISTPVKHFDTTLTPSKPAVAQPSPPDASAPAPASAPVVATNDVAPKEAPADPAAAAALETPDLPTNKPDEPATQSETSSALSNPEPTEPKIEPEPQPAEAPAPEINDLDSILGKNDAPSDEAAENDARTAGQSEEFKNVLKEFTVNQPEDREAKPFVAVHKHDYLRKITIGFLWLLAVVALAAVILDVLLDTGVLQDFYGLPHTTFF